jgi:hypothetical protein
MLSNFSKIARNSHVLDAGRGKIRKVASGAGLMGALKPSRLSPKLAAKSRLVAILNSLWHRNPLQVIDIYRIYDFALSRLCRALSLIFDSRGIG